jgi:hypothetical protein
MIEDDQVDLSEGFAIKFVECDCGLDFPGDSLETVPSIKDCFRLKKE